MVRLRAGFFFAEERDEDDREAGFRAGFLPAGLLRPDFSEVFFVPALFFAPLAFRLRGLAARPSSRQKASHAASSSSSRAVSLSFTPIPMRTGFRPGS
ncbi:MAG: hypothetical protein ABJI28_07725, partial [Nitratireductor sp.]